jgi:hypothetical protein
MKKILSEYLDTMLGEKVFYIVSWKVVHRNPKVSKILDISQKLKNKSAAVELSLIENCMLRGGIFAELKPNEINTFFTSIKNTNSLTVHLIDFNSLTREQVEAIFLWISELPLLRRLDFTSIDCQDWKKLKLACHHLKNTQIRHLWWSIMSCDSIKEEVVQFTILTEALRSITTLRSFRLTTKWSPDLSFENFWEIFKLITDVKQLKSLDISIFSITIKSSFYWW